MLFTTREWEIGEENARGIRGPFFANALERESDPILEVIETSLSFDCCRAEYDKPVFSHADGPLRWSLGRSSSQRHCSTSSIRCAPSRSTNARPATIT